MEKKMPRARRASSRDEQALVDEAGAESFPASDPPAWTTGVERRPARRPESR